MFKLPHTVKRSIVLDAPPHEVWEAVTDEVDLVEEAERLAFESQREGSEPSRVELIVDAVAGGTRLTVIETGRGFTASPLLAAGWTPRLASLRLALGRLVLA
ncbi:MAG: hypothetical protein WD810_09735 [Solirubrobacterales bacterium]